jgi:hypothetical protein
MSTINLILDILLVVASIWMVLVVRGIGGIFGRTLNLIVAGTIVLGIAHLVSTLGKNLFPTDSPIVVYDSLIHRVIVLIGFVVLVFGFRQLAELKK